MIGRLLLFFIVFQAGCIVSFAQIDDCEISLNQATEELNAGHFHGIDSLLAPCLKSGFSREQRQRAYLLLTQVYLLLDDSEAAKASYLELLRANPEFEADRSKVSGRLSVKSFNCEYSSLTLKDIIISSQK